MTQDHYEVHDSRFLKLIHTNASLDILWDNGRWCEGPAYLAAGRYVIWSDIPNDRVMRWDENDGHVSVFATPCNNHNGHTVDLQGRLVSCEHMTRRVSRIEHGGETTILADRFTGRRLNSPNDVVVKSDGTIWFSDPTYGIDSDYEGKKSPSDLGSSDVYRINLDGSVSRVITDLAQPNGLAFSPDERLLYVADTGQTHDPSCTPTLSAYPLQNADVGPGQTLATCDVGLFDGFRVDTDGNIWTSAGDGVHCYAPDGALLGKILIDEVVANLVFGGPKKNRLFICATTSLRAIYVNARGCSR